MLLFQLPPYYGNQPGSVEHQLDESLRKLRLSYVDLYLIHVPFAFKGPEGKDADGNWVLDSATDHIVIWKVSMVSG